MAIQLFPSQQQLFQRPAPIAEDIRYTPYELQLFPQMRRTEAVQKSLNQEVPKISQAVNEQSQEISPYDAEALKNLFYQPEETTEQIENRSKDASQPLTQTKNYGTGGTTYSDVNNYDTSSTGGTSDSSSLQTRQSTQNPYVNAAASGVGAAGTYAAGSAAADALGLGGTAAEGGSLLGGATAAELAIPVATTALGAASAYQHYRNAPSSRQNTGGHIARGAAEGFAVGGPAGAIVGGIAGGIHSLTASRYRQEAMDRDGIVQQMIDMGGVHDEGDGHYLVRADGSAYDIFGDGGYVPGTERASFDIDLKDPLSTAITPMSELMAVIVGGGEGKPATDMAGYLTNAAISNANGSYRTARSNLLSFMRDSGITTLEQIQDRLTQLRQNGLISEGTYQNMVQTANTLLPNQSQYTDENFFSQYVMPFQASQQQAVPLAAQNTPEVGTPQVTQTNPNASQKGLTNTSWAGMWPTIRSK